MTDISVTTDSAALAGHEAADRAAASGRAAAAGRLADGIGRRLAAYRGERGMRVAELAREVGVTPSLISQIERGQSRPSVATLFAMAQALGVPVDAFFREPGRDQEAADGRGADAGEAASSQPALAAGEEEARYVVRRGGRAAVDIEGGVRWERLTPRTLRHFDFLELIYAPGAQSNETLYTHPGTEMVLVTSGRLDIYVGFERYRLEGGDSMYLPSSVPHRYVNPGDETARAVTVIVHEDTGDARGTAAPGIPGSASDRGSTGSGESWPRRP